MAADSLLRTLPTNVYFGGDGPGVDKLRRVLAAMSWHNPVVGYCQVCRADTDQR